MSDRSTCDPKMAQNLFVASECQDSKIFFFLYENAPFWSNCQKNQAPQGKNEPRFENRNNNPNVIHTSPFSSWIINSVAKYEIVHQI